MKMRPFLFRTPCRQRPESVGEASECEPLRRVTTLLAG